MELPAFTNEPFTDFSDPANKQAFEAALETIRGELGRTWPAWVGGEAIQDKPGLVSTDPCQLNRVIGTCQDLGADEANAAVEAAHSAFPAWADTTTEYRAKILMDAAAMIRDRKHEWSALMVYEAGKSWPEADADTAEAIDFLEYYARQALHFAKPQPVTPVAGEANELRYIPLGTAAVIPPWNFPFAIMAGMTTSALVCGNTVVLKPAEQTPVIAARFVQLMHEAGLPKEVLQFVTGDGATVGGAMVNHPRTRLVSFTGSREVGLMLHEHTAKVQPGQIWMKRYIAEMGGKDGMLIDKDCDLDHAAQGVTAAAFGFQGQKCSACSRVMIHQDVYETFREKLLACASKLQAGHPEQLDNVAGPVIDPDAVDKISRYIAIGKEEGELILGGERGDAKGHYFQPTIFDGIAPEARLSREEIFGPVLAMIKVRDFEHGLEVANNTEYGLTGAVYTDIPAHKEAARKRFHVGNFYINRKCTGALVGGHPFGGFNMSGTDSKAGGPDYLLHFMQGKLISERIT